MANFTKSKITEKLKDLGMAGDKMYYIINYKMQGVLSKISTILAFGCVIREMSCFGLRFNIIRSSIKAIQLLYLQIVVSLEIKM